MISVGFSTRKTSFLSGIIRRLTKSKTSHTWLLVEDSVFGVPLVMEATEVGFRCVALPVFEKQNLVITIVKPIKDISSGMHAAAMWLGSQYDFAGLFGTAIVLLGRWLKRKWRNPFYSPQTMFCSEAVVRVLQEARYPGAVELDPEAATPQDVLEFLMVVKPAS